MGKNKYRVWCPEDKIMTPVSAIHFNVVTHEIQKVCRYYDRLWVYLSQYELMQYTGLKDKNGVEIYEGDVVKMYIKACEYRPKLFPSCIEVAKVEWLNVGFMLERPYAHSADRFKQLISSQWNLEVIGNIHESPELLEAK